MNLDPNLEFPEIRKSLSWWRLFGRESKENQENENPKKSIIGQ